MSWEDAVRHVADDSASIERDADGKWRGRYTWVVTDEAMAECRAGYRCIGCMESFRGSDGLPESYPERCPVCGYRVRELQAFDMGPEHRGEVRIGPGTTLEEELEIMESERKKRLWLPGSSIPIPRALE